MYRHTTPTPLCLAASVAVSQLRQGTIGTPSLTIRHGFCPAAAPSPLCLAASGAVSQLRQGTSGTPSLARIQGVCLAVRAARSRGSKRQQQRTASSCSKDLCSTGRCSRQPDLAAKARAHKDNSLRSHRSRADLSRDRWIQSPECWPLHHETTWTHSAALLY